MKRIFNAWLLLTLLCGLSLGVVSCKDDDKNDGNTADEQQQNQDGDDDENSAYALLERLADLDEADEDYLKGNYEPTIGMPDGDNEGVRIVNTNTMELAMERASSILGTNISESTPSYEWSDAKMGKLTYTKGDGSTAWATIDVDIKQVPKLEKIIFRTTEQSDDNATFKGSAYYRFGDVVSRDVKNKNGTTTTEFWICVRPAFGIEGKQDSHWVCVNALPEKNVFTYTDKATNQTWYLPTKLGDELEHVRNFAELIFALIHPDQWEKNVREGDKKMPFFHDFKRTDKKGNDRVKYHNENFWGLVSRAWSEHGIWQKVLNADRYDIAEMIDAKKEENRGLHLLYKGFTWKSKPNGQCGLWQIKFTNGTGAQANMHKEVLSKPSKAMKGIQFDCRVMGLQKKNYHNFFGDNYVRWPIRVATGSDLASGGKYSATKKIPGVTDVYRYYTHVAPEHKLTDSPEVTASCPYNAPFEGQGGTYQIGDVLAVKGSASNPNPTKFFCILGSPYSRMFPLPTDKHAMFVSFQCNDNRAKCNDNMEMISEEDLPEVAMKFTSFLTHINLYPDDLNFDPKKNKLGIVGEHILKYAGVDLRKLVTVIDSTWTTTHYGTKITYESKSQSFAFNIAYKTKDGNRALARVIYDRTQAGDHRGASLTKSGKKYQDWHYRLYKHYEIYDPDRIEVTDDEASIGWTKWQKPWPMTTDLMGYQDAANQALVDKYSEGDKWQREPKRTKAETSISVEDYYWENGGIAKTSIFNEPVLNFFVMRIEDNGGLKPNLVSDTKTQYEIVHLLNNYSIYNGCLHSSWASNYTVDSQRLFFLDNELYKVKQLPGIPQ